MYHAHWEILSTKIINKWTYHLDMGCNLLPFLPEQKFLGLIVIIEITLIYAYKKHKSFKFIHWLRISTHQWQVQQELQQKLGRSERNILNWNWKFKFSPTHRCHLFSWCEYVLLPFVVKFANFKEIWWNGNTW